VIVQPEEIIATAPGALSVEVLGYAMELIRHGRALEAERVLAQALGSGPHAKALVAWEIKRRLALHN